LKDYKIYFESLRDYVHRQQREREYFTFNFCGEISQFIRINGPKVRQIGTVEDFTLHITMILESPQGELKKAASKTNLTCKLTRDQTALNEIIENLRREIPTLPVDSYAQIPQDHGSSSRDNTGTLLPIAEATEILLRELNGVDIAGLYAAGQMYRAMGNSTGQSHWFSSENFIFDYSLYTPDKKAIKACYAGAHWDPTEYRKNIAESRQKLSVMQISSRQIARGTYRTYLEPAAFGDLIQMLSWGGISEASIQQGESPLRLLRSGQRSFSPLFSLTEDFSFGSVPRFNSDGELPMEQLPMIQQGKLVNAWISSRSAHEYKIPPNGAEFDERLRSPVVSPGTLPAENILSTLDTGLYLSNLHYLNWSDQPGGRITGMTRYACFWVENGELIAPIENVRFDDTLFHLLGNHLEALTQFQTYLPEVATYGTRSLGGLTAPGALLSEFSFTL
jgi:predicted Zn-dependent protease